MLKYILKRLLIFIPTLIVISLLTFVISQKAPGDPVENMLNRNQGGEGQAAAKIAGEKAYMRKRSELGLDLPVFYFSISNATSTDTLYRIPKSSHRETLERLAWDYGNWDHVATYYRSVRSFELDLYNFNKTPSTAETITKVKEYVNLLYLTYEESKIKSILNNIESEFRGTKSFLDLNGGFNSIRNTFENIVHSQNISNRYIPNVHWYGFNNQYHRWFFHFIQGDFGISYQDQRPVSSALWDALKNTLSISLLSILLAYLLAIPLGISTAVHKGTRKEKIITTTLFILYSLPVFWIATLTVFFFCCGDYWCWFPAPGTAPIPEDAPLLYQFGEWLYRMALPLLCLTYGSLAFISRQMRGGMINILGQDFIRTARAKGLEESKVVNKHALRNSLIPIITLFANVFPAAIAGSIVVEHVFNIPGMGKLTIDAINARNYPVIFSTMMCTAVLTMIGNLVADILYAMVDPRISFTSKS
ncbi:MAG: ABC transporter permease [Bacteroidia bacterium]|nr:ABC transporter permease [Bacteroidia bacterium]